MHFSADFPDFPCSGNYPQIFRVKFSRFSARFSALHDPPDFPLIFPLAGEWDGEGLILGTAADQEYIPEDADPDYEGYLRDDDYTHYEVFSTATPEPDSAAAEYDFR